MPDCKVLETSELLDPSLVVDVDSKKMPEHEALFWKVCVMCEAYMRVETRK